MADELDPLVIKIDDPQYDAETGVASVTLNHAFGAKKHIDAYEGEHVTLVNHDKALVENCPEIQVNFNMLSRDIRPFINQVELSMGGVSQTKADEVENAGCMIVDTTVVKAISSLGWTPPNAAEQRSATPLEFNK